VTKHNLPPQSTPFVGRTEELTQIAHLLADPTCRLLTLLGPGGIGKTRLALETAAAQLEHYRDGVYLVPLQALSSLDFIVPAIAEALHFQFYPGGEPKQQLLDYLREKSWLLMLDNFEHLLDGVDLLTDILSHAPAVKLLVTSRQRLNLSSETVYTLGGLDMPSEGLADNALDSSAVKLFVQRARRLRPHFALNDDWVTLARICRLVDGMPLAILLAAAWVEVLSLQEIALEIEHSLDFLETEMRDLPERHRTMRAAFDPTWKRLAEAEQEVFKKLSVFRGGFTREAAQAVAGATLKTLMGLVDKSLVQVMASGRYDLHELLRQYGEDKLCEKAEDNAAARETHLFFYAAFAAAQGEEMRGTRMNEAVEATRLEYDNLLTAWYWACEHLEHHSFLWDFASCWYWFFFLEHRHHEALSVFEPALIALRQLENVSQLAGVLLAIRSFLLFIAARHDEAALSSNQAVLVLDQLDDAALRREAGMALFMVSFVCGGLGQYADHKRFGERGLFLCRERRWYFEYTYSLLAYPYPLLGYYLTVDYDYQGDLREARLLIEEGLRIAQDIAQPFLLGWGNCVLGALAVREGNLVEAKSALLKSFHASNAAVRGAIFLWLTVAALKAGEYQEARYWCQQAFQLISHVGMHFNSAHALVLATAEVLAGLGEYERATELIGWCRFHWGDKRFASLAKWQTTTHIDRLEVQLGRAVYAAAVTRGQSVDSKAIIPSLLGELSKLERLAAESTGITRGSGFHVEPLTERELEILRLIADGLSNQAIADKLILSLGTVKWYTGQIYSKLGVQNRAQAAVHAQQLNLLS
jgi:predicted ATPase/DNA-binding CsgD family transcriptional regulator